MPVIKYAPRQVKLKLNIKGIFLDDNAKMLLSNTACFDTACTDRCQKPSSGKIRIGVFHILATDEHKWFAKESRVFYTGHTPFYRATSVTPPENDQLGCLRNKLHVVATLLEKKKHSIYTRREVMIKSHGDIVAANGLHRNQKGHQVEAEAELRGWQGFPGWARIRSHTETTDHSRKLASALVCRWRRSGHVIRSSAWLIPYIF